MRERAATDGGRARPADPLLVVGVVLIALQTCLRAAVVLGSGFWQDDFFHLSLFQQTGLSRDFVVRGYNGHLEIGPNLVYALIGRDPSLSFVPAGLILIALQLTASCLLLAVLRQLFGRSPWMLVPFTAYLFTPLGLAVSTWLAAGLEALPLQIAMLTVLLGGIRAYRSRSRRWGLVSVAGTAAGLLFYEKAALVLPTLVVVLVLVEEAGTPWRRALRRVADFWPFLLPHAVLVAAYVSFYQSVVVRPALDADLGGLVPTTAETLFTMLLPGLFGGPWAATEAQGTFAAEPGVLGVVVAAVLALGIVAVSIWLRGARAVKAWLLVAGYLAVDLALVQLTRASIVDIVARDPRYITDALPVLTIGCCAAFSGPRRALSTAGRRVLAVPAAPVAAAVSALLVVSSLLSTSLVLDEAQHHRTRDYFADVLRTMDSGQSASVLSGGVPLDVFFTLSDAFDLDDVLRALGQEHAFDRPGTEMGMFDAEGVLRPITLLAPILEASGPDEGCGWPLPDEGQQIGELPIWFGTQVLRFAYDSPAEVTLHLAVGNDRQDLAVPPGRGQAWFVVTGQQGPVTVRASGAPAGELCVDDIVVGSPWPEGRTPAS